MKRFLVIFLDLISFGVTYVLRRLVKNRSKTFSIDIDGDGNNDIHICISDENDKGKEE